MYKHSKQISKIVTIISFLLVIFISTNSYAASSPGANNFGYPLKSTKIVKGYQASANQYGPGHRGTDFEAKPGTAVYSIAPGQVIFAGKVNGHLFVSIDHGNEIVSTYSLATKTIKVADVVDKGKVIGTVGVPLEKDDVNTFHFSMRVKDKYVDPMSYITGVIPVREITLYPVKGENKSWWEKKVEQAKEFIKDSFEFAGETISDGISKFNKYFVDKGKDMVQDLFKKAGDAYAELKKLRDLAVDYMNKFDEAVKKGANDLVNFYKKKIGEVAGLMKEAGKKAVDAFVKAKDALVDIVKYGGKIGGFVGGLAIKYLKGRFDLLANAAKDLFGVLTDPFISAWNSGKKIFDHYYDWDWDAARQWLSSPISCIMGNCSSPLKKACDSSAKASQVLTKDDGYKGSGNPALIVSGLNSFGNPDPKLGQPTTEIDYKRLGYSDKNVQFYSYKGTDKTFKIEDTYQDINVSVKLMDEQVKDFAKKHPGEKMDLLAHSLGGAVTSMWLAKYYDESDPAYPVLGKIVMFAPALTGTDSADLLDQFKQTPQGSAARDLLSVAPITGDLIPPSDAKIVEQLQEDGYIDKTLTKSGVGKKYEIYSLRDGSDIVVTSGSDTLDGVKEVPLGGSGVVNAGWAHSNIVKSDKAISQVQRILTGKKVACISGSDAFSFVTGSVIVHTGESFLESAVSDMSASVGVKK